MELKLLSLSEDDKLIRECMEQASAFYGCLGKMGVTEILCDRKKAQELGADCQITGIFTGGELTAFACAFEYTGLKRNGRKWLNPGDKEWRQIETLGTNVVVIPLLVGKEKVGRLIELLREQYRDSHLLFRISGEQSEKFQEDLAVVSEKNLKSHRYDAAGENVWLFHFAPQIRMEDTYFEEEILLILPGQEVLLEMGIEEAEVTMVKLTGYEIVRSEKGSAFFRKPGAACEGVLLQCDYEQLLRYQRFINLTNYEEHFEQTDRGKALIYSEKYQSDSSLLWNDLLREMVKTALKNLIYKHCFIKEINIRIYFREQLMEDALHTEVKKYYAIEEETEIAEYAKKLQNAYYIAEDEQGDKYYIGAKLYGHVFQALIPGQFLTYDGKYYEVQAITPQNGVVVRRAADHITDRVYYRQLRHIRINDWKDDENIGGQKSVEGISIYKGYCEIDIETAGYLEMTSYENLNAAKEVRVSGIPVRSYRNKLVMKLNLPDVSERVRYTLCLLLNEIFRTIYPDAYPYICAVTLVDTNHAPEKLKGAMYTLSGKVDGSAIYIVEDSEIDLGLIASVERNLKRYFEIITEVLMWHEQKMAENPEKESKPEDYETPFTPEAGKEEEAAKKAREKAEKENKRFLGKIKRKLRKFWEKITAGFKKKPKDEPVEETPTEETPTEETPIEETPEEGISEDSPTEETTSTDERNTETGTENVMKNVMYSAEAEMDIEGEDEQLVEQKMTKKTEYQKSCFLKYGYEEIDPYFDFGGTIKYLTKYGYDRNPLQQVRDGVKAAEADNAKYDPHKEGSHFCDFCGVELAGGEYELLKDGRERCNHCSSTALRTGEEFKEVYKMVVRNMEIFFGIKLNVAIKVRMTDAKTIAKHFGEEFVATPGFDGRVLGFAQKDSSGYSLYIENGSPKLAAMATIAHELTHIWQYQNWDEKMILSKYGKQYRLEIYEGMAKWAEIQYLLYLNEISYAKRQEIVTRLRDDEYGRGFIQYAKKYPLAYRHEKNATPFGRIPPL